MNDDIMRTVEAILKRGNDAEIRRKGDGYIVLEVGSFVLSKTREAQRFL